MTAERKLAIQWLPVGVAAFVGRVGCAFGLRRRKCVPSTTGEQPASLNAHEGLRGLLIGIDGHNWVALDVEVRPIDAAEFALDCAPVRETGYGERLLTGLGALLFRRVVHIVDSSGNVRSFLSHGQTLAPEHATANRAKPSR